ncbi:MAG: DUF1206 domain-containing protein [Candidatus Nanopelagicales bacterium]
MSEPVDTMTDVAADIGDSEPLGWAARVGLVARAVVYLLIGALGLSLLAGNPAELDQKGALAELMERPFGRVLVLLCAIGFAGYALWRYAEAATGVAVDGDDTKARLKSLARGVIYTILAFTAVTVLLGSRTSQAGQQRGIVARVLEWPAGEVLVIAAGVIVVGAGLALVVEGWRHKFLKYLDHTEMSDATRSLVRWTGTVGSIARGLVVVLVGVLLILAAVTGDKAKASGFDGALKSLRELPFGDLILALASIGLIVFGVYALLEARYRRVGVSRA